MKTSRLFSTIFAASLLAGTSFAQTTATSDPVGFVNVTVPANSDAVLAVPMNRTAAFKGVIQSINQTTSPVTITVAGTSPAWGANQFVFNGPLDAGTDQLNTYAVQLASGAKEGMIGKVTANGGNTVTIQLDAADDFTGITTEVANGTGNGDHIDIMPFWTPGSLLGTTLPAATEFLGFEGVGAGVNKAATKVYGATGSSWEDGDTSDDVTHSPLQFGYAFVLRNNGGTLLSLSFVGSVPMSASRIRISTLGSSIDQDQRFGFMSPIPEPIISLGIPAVAGDIIFGFNNAATGKNKAASITYAYDGTQWVNDETGDPLTAADTLQPGFGYLFRKFRTISPTSVVWQRAPSYLQ